MNAIKFTRLPFKPHRQQQTGFALFAALMFMVGLTVLAVTVLRSSTLGERIAGNDIDRVRAYQAAEATLRDAQLDIQHLTSAGVSCIGISPCRAMNLFPSRENGETDLAVGCTAGICFIPTATMQTDGIVGPWDSSHSQFANSAQFGQFSGANWTQLSTAIGTGVQLATQPRYWIEIIPPLGEYEAYRYRITATASGVNANTLVTLQETFQP